MYAHLQKPDPSDALVRRSAMCQKLNRTFTDHQVSGGFPASLAPVVVANRRDESPARGYAAMSSDAAVATAISAEISSRSKSSRAPTLWASWRIGQLLREMTIRSVATLACSAQRVADSSRAEPMPRRRQFASRRRLTFSGDLANVPTGMCRVSPLGYGRIANARAGKPRPLRTLGHDTTISAPFAGT
jgi:hypothetical protein